MGHASNIAVSVRAAPRDTPAHEDRSEYPLQYRWRVLEYPW